MRIQHLDPSAREDLLRDLLKRSPDQYGAYEAQVAQILEEVREREMRRCLPIQNALTGRSFPGRPSL